MFERMTDRARRVLLVAQYEAEERFGRSKIGTEHILLALVAEDHAVTGRILLHFGVQEEAVRQVIVDQVEPAEHRGKLMFTPNASLAFERVLHQAIKTQGGKGKGISIDTEDLLLGIALTDCSAVRVLKALQVDIGKLIAVTEWSANGVEKQVAALTRSGQTEQIEEGFALLQAEIDKAEAVLDWARALRDRAASEVASSIA